MTKSKILTLFFVCIMSVICIVKLAQEPVVQETQAIEGGDSSKILLYFYDRTSKTLAPEYRNIPLEEIKENLEETIVLELLKGPTLPEYERIIPIQTKLEKLEKDGSKIILNFSKDFVSDAETEEDRAKKIFSIVY